MFDASFGLPGIILQNIASLVLLLMLKGQGFVVVIPDINLQSRFGASEKNGQSETHQVEAELLFTMFHPGNILALFSIVNSRV